MNEFYSHSKQSPEGKVFGNKLLQTHISNVLNIAINQIYPNTEFDFSNEKLIVLLESLVKYHDLGKYTSYFQNYLLKIQPINKTFKQHARIGGIAAYNYLKNTGEKEAIICAYLIFMHHSKLKNLDDFAGSLNYDTSQVFKVQSKDIQDKTSIIENELKIADLKKYLFFPEDRSIRKFIKVWLKKDSSIQDYFLINYLFSLLIQGDKLDASDTKLYKRKPINSNWVDKRFGKTIITPFDKNNLISLKNNEMRNYCRNEVISHLRREDILDYYIFTLTAPTGIGKTMTALDFALKLKERIFHSESFEPQIIYALPFINIIEQALSEYNTTLPDDVMILAHYQYADVFGIQEDLDDDKYNQKLMKIDTWQSDVVITSFVQFFETLISNRNKLLKKFNHFAGSIIILDEVQTLRLDQMPLIGAVLHYLAKFLKARIILMTATKPKIFELAENEILNIENEKPKVIELLASHEKVFATFSRTSIIPIIHNFETEKEPEFAFGYNYFNENWEIDKSCIIVCNTVNRSIKLFDTIKVYLNNKRFTNPLFYLSTNILPAHRFEIIENIKKSLEDNLAPILISTQVVEAGVDLDFDMGFRDLGPIDSIIQVAGRINRNNNPKKANAPLYIVDFGDCKKIYGHLTYNQVKIALENKSTINEPDYLQLINRYFDNISGSSSFLTSRKIFESMKILKYDSSNPREDHTVSSFKIIIDSGNYMSVFVESDKRAIEARKKYEQLVENKISQEQFAPFKKIFHQQIIAVPEYLQKSMEIKQNNWLLSENLWYLPFELVHNFYNEETGFIRKAEKEEVVCML